MDDGSGEESAGGGFVEEGPPLLVQVGFRWGSKWLHGPTVEYPNAHDTLADLYNASAPEAIKSRYFVQSAGICQSS